MNVPRGYFSNMKMKWESLLYQIKTFRSCQRKNKKTTNGFNKILIQNFSCYIFRSSDKVKSSENNTTLI